MKYVFAAVVVVAILLAILMIQLANRIKPADLSAARLAEGISIAKRALPKFRARLEHPEPADRSFFVRAEFTGKDRPEFLWISHVRLATGGFQGTIAETPSLVGRTHLGDTVTVKDSQVVDWTIVHDDQSREGNYTQGLEPAHH